MSKMMMKFTVPESVAKMDKISSITIRELSAGERLELFAKYPNDFATASFVLHDMSIAEIDGVAVDRIKASAMREKASSKLQELIGSAYNAVNMPTEQERASFLDSAEVILS